MIYLNIRLASQYRDLEAKLADKERECENFKRTCEELRTDNTRLAGELSTKVRELNTLTDEHRTLQTQYSKMKLDNEDLRERLRHAELEIVELERQLNEVRPLLEKWTLERNNLLQENQRLHSINHDKTVENDRKTYENSKLLIRLALAYAEIERRLID